MPATLHRRIGPVFLFLALVVFGTAKAIPPPPDRVELTSAEMKGRNIAFKIHRYRESSIELRFPKRLLVKDSWLVPYYTYLVVKNKAGDTIASTTNQVLDNENPSISGAYDHAISDLSVSITYGCPQAGSSSCHGATTFAMSSVSRFFDANADAVNLPLKCRKVADAPLDMDDCTERD
jgi:hypothetical protein